jgi:phage tail tape-measure protein
MTNEKRDNREAHREPASGPLGTHPVSTGLGAVAGGMAVGAAVGTVAGPVGTIAGATAGAIVGGMAGKAIGKAIDPKVEDAYWQKTYSKEVYYQAGLSFDDYRPAYRTGYQGRAQFAGRKFDDVQNDLEGSYSRTKGSSKLGWDKAKHAVRAAWDRVEGATPGDVHPDAK